MPFLTVTKSVADAVGDKPRISLPFVSSISLIKGDVIVLFVSVCVPVSVATVESIAIVTALEPLYDVPDKPVPMVKALDAVAVTVTEPPKLTDEPLIVMALLVRLALPMLLKVLSEPLIVFPVNVDGMSALTNKRKAVGASTPLVGPAYT